jgi:hypothetical protein
VAVTIDGLAERLIRMAIPDPGYHLERVPVCGPVDVLRWLHDWHGEDGDYTWVSVTDKQRARVIDWWPFLRRVHSDEWQQRGGVDA